MRRPMTTRADGASAVTGGSSGHVDLPLSSGEAESSKLPHALRPAADGGPLAAVGASDRGIGLEYKAGRLAIDYAAAAAVRGATRPAREGRWLVKVQPPLDNSSDAAGGMGRMTPATLLVHDETGDFCTFVREEQRGHGALLRCALRSKGQVAYLWAQDVRDANGRPAVRVHTDLADSQSW